VLSKLEKRKAPGESLQEEHSIRVISYFNAEAETLEGYDVL